MFEVRTVFNRYYFATKEAAEEEYFNQCNQCGYVALMEHKPGKPAELLRESY